MTLNHNMRFLAHKHTHTFNNTTYVKPVRFFLVHADILLSNAKAQQQRIYIGTAKIRVNLPYRTLKFSNPTIYFPPWVFNRAPRMHRLLEKCYLHNTKALLLTGCILQITENSQSTVAGAYEQHFKSPQVICFLNIHSILRKGTHTEITNIKYIRQLQT